MDMQEFDYELNPKFPESTDLLYPGEEEFALELDHFDPEMQEDKLWKARTGLDEDSLCGAIETVVFMSDRPVSLTKIKTMIDEDMPLRVLHDSIERLQSEYENKHHGIRLVEVAEGYQFRTKATYSKYVQDLFKLNSLVLSPTALEVLAIIAYKQPVAKTEIDKIRGVDSGHIARALMDKKLVKLCGRSDEMGRSLLYGTTTEFLEVFNLKNLDELPPEQELLDSLENKVGAISDIKTLVHSGDKAFFKFDETEELDQLSEAIKSISSDTEFTKSLKVEDKKRVSETGEAKKSAYELLEEFVVKEATITNNQIAALSEMISTAILPDVVSDLTAGPFNVPEEEEEEFEMIDLDSGEAIPSDEPEAEENILEAVEEVKVTPEFDTDDAAELAKALDEAFDKMMAPSIEGELDSSDDSEIEKQTEKMQELEDDMVEKASDLDIDLSFLKGNSDDSDILDLN